MPDPVQLIPLEAIDDAAMPRDRSGLDPEALTELRLSIAANGLRMPVEVFELADPEPGAPETPHRYGLISGSRRLAAFRALFETARDTDRYAAIPAFVRQPAGVAAALTAMVEENAIRADLSPWEQGRVAVTARDIGAFDSIEAAVEALYASASRQKRARLRTLAHLAEELDGQLTAPETLSLRQALRLAAALTRGFGDLIRHVLAESSLKDPGSQWQALLPILVEAESTEPAEPAPHSGRPDRPRRTLVPRHGIRIWREMTRDGWCLHFTGRDATGMLIDGVLDEIERMFGPA